MKTEKSNVRKLGDYITVLTDYHANGSYERLKERVDLKDELDYAVMIRTTNFEKDDFNKDLKYITKDAYDFMAKSKVYPNDILMNKIANAGSVYRMPDLGAPVSLAMNLFLIRTDGKQLDQTYAYYYLKANEQYVKTFANGTATKTITKAAVRNLDIVVPDISIQIKVAQILLNYDNLIENNSKQIEKLESMARLIFENFLDDNLDKEEVRIGDIVELLNGYAFKSKDFSKHGRYGVVTIKNVQDGLFSTDSLSRIDFIPERLPEYCKLCKGDILLSLTGNVGRVCLVTKSEMLLNQRVAKLASKYRALTYCLFRSRRMLSRLENLSNGTAQQNLSPVLTRELVVALPKTAEFEKFELVCAPILDQIVKLSEKNSVLNQTRELLLPRIMSGDIEV